jgi:hypothetical protein
MKWTIYLLLLINIGFALWHIRSQDMQAAQVKQADDQALKLILLKEYAEASNNKSVDPTTTQIQASCYTLGPFKTAQVATAVRERMLKVGVDAQHRVNKNNTRPGFWVFLPPEQTRKAAQEHVSDLKSKNVKDYFLVVTGEYSNAVSLGVFSQPELAQRRSEELKALGFTVKLQKLDLPLREYWLDWPKAIVLNTSLLEAIRSEYSGVGQLERTCSASK